MQMDNGDNFVQINESVFELLWDTFASKAFTEGDLIEARQIIREKLLVKAGFMYGDLFGSNVKDKFSQKIIEEL